MTTTQNAAKLEILSMFNENLVGLQAAKKRFSSVLLGQGFIVQVEDVSLSFKCDGLKVSESKACGAPYNATRFTKQDAEMLAKIVKNGNNASGVAIHVKDAVDIAIADTLEQIAKIEAL